MAYSNYLSVAVACCLGFAGSAFAETNEAYIASLIRSGNLGAAQLVLLQSEPSIADTLFFQGLVAQHLGQLDEAVALFNETLVANPNHLNAQRELASTLFLKGQYRLAERQFRELIKLDGSAAMRPIYQSYIDRIAKEQPLSFSGHISFLPSTNVNRGTDNLVFDSTAGQFRISPGSRAISGIGVQVGATGTYRLPAGNRTESLISFGINGAFYEQPSFNSAVFTIRYSHGVQLSDINRLGFSVYSRYSWYGSDADNVAAGLVLSAGHRLSSQDHVSFKLKYEYRHFDIQDYNTGVFTAASLRYGSQPSPSLAYGLDFGISRLDSNSQHSNYTGLELIADVQKGWSGGLVTGAGISVGMRDYDIDFPLAGEPRADRYFGISLSARNNAWNFSGFTPELRCSYKHNQSNIALYQHDITECDLSISRRF